MKSSSKKIGLLLIGGKHHILHLIPIAAELVQIDQIEVILFVTSETERDMCKTVLTGLGMMSTDIRILRGNSLASAISPKLAILFGSISQIKTLDALIVAERTSTILRHVMRRFPLFIHIPHGAGDRSKSYDPRIRHFDHVLVAGEKDKNRMIDLDLVGETSCHVTGYIKPYAVRQLYPDPPRLFETNKTTILYNPHFSSTLSSWPEFGFDLLDHFASRLDMNFIIAPHIRMFQNASSKARDTLEAFNQHPNIHVDLGSERSTDMTYTRAADIYLGDVSSQVYEFLSSPKPCVFIGSKQISWEGNPDYAHWRYGRVCHTVNAVMSALERAPVEHSDYVDVQREGCRAAMGEPDWNPAARAAKVVASLLR